MRRHQRLLAALAFGLLALAVEVTGRSLTHRIDRALHVSSPIDQDESYYPFLLAGVKIGVALLLARLVWRFARALTRARAGEFRSNLHRGGSATKIRLPAEYRKTALAAARVLGLRLAGVDMLESKDGPMIMEVNSSPGLEGIQKTTGADVADSIIELLEHEVTPVGPR